MMWRKTMIEVTREDKIEKILEYWEEGWYNESLEDAFDEMKELYKGELKPFSQWSDDEIQYQYEDALEFFDEQ